jgi:hypothetical protein
MEVGHIPDVFCEERKRLPQHGLLGLPHIFKETNPITGVARASLTRIHLVEANNDFREVDSGSNLGSGKPWLARH